MPIPFLLAGLGVAAGVLGAGGHLSAKDTNEKAQRRMESAQELYNNAKNSLELAQNKTEEALLKLGYEKKNVLDSSMRQFLRSYDKIKNVKVTRSDGINELSKFTIDQQETIKLREMTNIYSSAIFSGATGAAAGAIVALAASGSLTLVTGELSFAGATLMAGEIGAAAGIAGSALSFGAAMTPLAAVAAPVILFTGISASMKAEENLEKANTMYAEAEVAAEKMETSEVLCGAITERSEMFDTLLMDLNKMFAECTSLLAGVLRKKEGMFFKKKLTSSDFTKEDIKLIAVTRALAGAVKSVIDMPILSSDGSIAYESEKVYEQTRDKLPDFSQAVEEVQEIDYGVKPIKAGNINSKLLDTVGEKLNLSDSVRTTIFGESRNIAAIILGIVLATVFAARLANMITTYPSKFLFLNSFAANCIAFWLLMCTSIVMLAGDARGTIIEKICSWGSGIAIFILYVQYCRSVERMRHSIIFSILFLFIFAILYSLLEKRIMKWQFGKFIITEIICAVIMPLLFLIYAFFSSVIHIPTTFCLVATSVLMLLLSVGGMVGTVEG